MAKVNFHHSGLAKVGGFERSIRAAWGGFEMRFHHGIWVGMTFMCLSACHFRNFDLLDGFSLAKWNGMDAKMCNVNWSRFIAVSRGTNCLSKIHCQNREKWLTYRSLRSRWILVALWEGNTSQGQTIRTHWRWIKITVYQIYKQSILIRRECERRK